MKDLSQFGTGIFLKEIGFLWGAQVWMILFFPFVADEAYYWTWSTQLSWGYFDHPPGVAFWMAGGGRWLNWSLLFFAWYLWVDVGKILGVSNSYRLILMILTTPLGFSSGILCTPDSPLLFCWSLAVWATIKHRHVLSVLSISLGLWCKSMMLVGALGIIIIWMYTDSSRWKIKTFLKCIGVCLLYSPHIEWSLHHFGLPWSFQSSRSFGSFHTLEWIAGQVAVATPIWCICAVHLLRQRGKSVFISTFLSQTTRKTSLSLDQTCFLLSFPTLLLWFILSFLTRVEANWTALAWPPLLLWILGTCTEREYSRGIKWGRRLTYPLLCLPLVHHIIPITWGPPRDGHGLAKCLKKEFSGKTIWIAGRYQEASMLHQADFPILYFRGLNPRASQFDLSSTLLPHLEERKKKKLIKQYLHNEKMNQSSFDKTINRSSSILSLIYIGSKSWIESECLLTTNLVSKCSKTLVECVPKNTFLNKLISPHPIKFKLTSFD